MRASDGFSATLLSESNNSYPGRFLHVRTMSSIHLLQNSTFAQVRFLCLDPYQNHLGTSKICWPYTGI